MTSKLLNLIEEQKVELATIGMKISFMEDSDNLSDNERTSLIYLAGRKKQMQLTLKTLNNLL